MPPATSASSTPPGASSSSSASTTSASSRRTRTARRITGKPRPAPASPAEQPAQLADHRLVRAQLVGLDGLGQALEQLALLALELARDHDVGHDAQVALPPAAAAPQRRHALAAHGDDLAG